MSFLICLSIFLNSEFININYLLIKKKGPSGQVENHNAFTNLYTKFGSLSLTQPRD
jgi:hypothetical protein